MMNKKKKVLILGAGFAGLRTALDLHKKGKDIFEIKIISKTSHVEYYPALYKVATGKAANEICIPLDRVFQNTNVDVLIDEVVSVDLKSKKVYSSTLDYDYDILVMALGSEAEFFGIPGVDKGTFTFKSVSDAIKINKHIHEVFSRHHDLPQEKQEDNLHFVIVGGGPSGMELAGEFSSYLKKLAGNHQIPIDHLHIDLIDSGARLLPTFSEVLSLVVFEKLYKLGINIFLNHRVKFQEGNVLHIGDLTIRSETIIWTAGVAPSKIYKKIEGLQFDKKGRVLVDEYLGVPGFENVYIAGDSAGTIFTGTAQNAISNGRYLGKVIFRKQTGKEIKKYIPQVNHLMLPIKKGWGLLSFHDFIIVGWVAFWIREFVDLTYFLSILPMRDAYKLWRDGETICEQCKICGKDNEDPL